MRILRCNSGVSIPYFSVKRLNYEALATDKGSQDDMSGFLWVLLLPHSHNSRENFSKYVLSDIYYLSSNNYSPESNRVNTDMATKWVPKAH